MPHYTEIPNAVLEVGADLTLVTLPSTQIVNLFGPSEEFTRYGVLGGDDGTTLSQGDNMSLVDENDDPVFSGGTYLGEATLSTAAATVGIPGVAQLGLQVNPVSGHLMQGPDDGVYMITDDELSAARLGVTATITVAGQPFTVTAPISEIANQLADQVESTLGPILGAVPAAAIRGAQNTIQSALDLAIVTLEFDPEGTLELDPDDVVPCFTRGTLIETASGPVAVEDLKVGDLVRTRDNGLQPIRWIGSRKLGRAGLAAKPNLRPIRIRAGALGTGTPSADLLVSPQHRILVRSRIAQRMFSTAEVLVAAKQLLQLDGIEIADDLETVDYFHILFDRHEVVYSNGAETESLYTGPQALAGVGKAAREEIFALFPTLAETEDEPQAARLLPSGRQARKLAVRHLQHGKSLVM
ncbi:Hint domain-containing protein [Paracoccus siganidrum]|nr:Hint domain-containing protein [Paracoccus siganidrum]